MASASAALACRAACEPGAPGESRKLGRLWNISSANCLRVCSELRHHPAEQNQCRRQWSAHLAARIGQIVRFTSSTTPARSRESLRRPRLRRAHAHAGCCEGIQSRPEIHVVGVADMNGIGGLLQFLQPAGEESVCRSQHDDRGAGGAKMVC